MMLTKENIVELLKNAEIYGAVDSWKYAMEDRNDCQDAINALTKNNAAVANLVLNIIEYTENAIKAELTLKEHGINNRDDVYALYYAI